MPVIAVSAFRTLTVPAAALAFGSCAFALFASPGRLPPIGTPSGGASAIFAEPPSLREIRQIAIVQPAPLTADPVPPAETDVVLAPIRAVPVTPPTPMEPGDVAARASSKPVAATAGRATTGKRSAEIRPARIERVVTRAPGKTPTSIATVDEDGGWVAKTLGVGSSAAAFVAGGVKGARDTAFGLGRTVVSLVEDSL